MLEQGNMSKNQDVARPPERGRCQVGPGAKALACAVGVDSGRQGVGGEGCEGIGRFPI